MRHGMVKGQQNLSLALKVRKSLVNLLNKSLWVGLRSSTLKMLSSRWATTHMLASSWFWSPRWEETAGWSASRVSSSSSKII